MFVLDSDLFHYVWFCFHCVFVWVYCVVLYVILFLVFYSVLLRFIVFDCVVCMGAETIAAHRPGHTNYSSTALRYSPTLKDIRMNRYNDHV